MLVSALAMGLSVYWLTRRLAVGRWWLVYAATSLYLLFSGAYAVAHRLTGKGIDISVAYHLQTGLEGTGWLDFVPVLAVAALGLVLSLVLPAWLIRRLPAPSRHTPHTSHTSHTPHAPHAPHAPQTWPRGAALPLWLSLMVLVSAWAAHPGVHDVRKLGLAFFSSALASEDLYFTPPLVPESVQARGPARDLVWIYPRKSGARLSECPTLSGPDAPLGGARAAKPELYQPAASRWHGLDDCRHGGFAVRRAFAEFGRWQRADRCRQFHDQ